MADDSSGVVMELEYTEGSSKTAPNSADETRKVEGPTCLMCKRPCAAEMPQFRPLPEDRCINAAGAHGWCPVRRFVWSYVPDPQPTP